MKQTSFLLLLILFANISAFARNEPDKSVPDTTLNHRFNTEDDYFFEDKDEEFDLLNAPAGELYNFSWSSERLNPYRILIDSLPDTEIDCSGFVFPTAAARITSPFGPRRNRFHYGTDIGLSVGDTVVAAFDGTIRIVDYERRGYGHYVVIRHKNGLESVYAHLSAVLTEVNQDVAAGTPIGLGGSTGRSSGPHLHFELRFLGNAFNTTKVIDYDNKNCFSNKYYLTKTETFNHRTEIEKLKQARYHKVKRGETLSYIARRYGTTVTQLCRLNRISKNSSLKIGRTIRYR
jgi:murein DD-endopeptidase MepM/ murein hydrolase activator NlpD